MLYDKRIVALSGNCEAEKNRLFDELSGRRAPQGSKAGRFYYKYSFYTLVRLPSVYSVPYKTQKEKLTSCYILQGKADCVVFVADGTDLEASIIKALPLLGVTNRVIIYISRFGEAKKRGVHIDTVRLSALLGVPVVAASPYSAKGLNALLELLHLITSGALIPEPLKAENADFSGLARKICSEAITYKERKPRLRFKALPALLFALLALLALALFCIAVFIDNLFPL